MKILHTSDWHLGHMLYGYDRTEEQQSMLDQMVALVRSEQPDVLVMAGDVYDTAQPSAAVQTMLTKMIVALHDALPAMPIVMTAGNHDSGSKHEIFRAPWEALNVYAIGQLDKEHPERHILHLPGKGYVIAVPYAHERHIPEGWFQSLLDRTAQMNTEELPVVLTAHTTVTGCDYAGHEHATDTMVGGIDMTDVAGMGEGYDYLALGHIHKPQFVHTGRHNVRYSGSPVAVSFDEAYAHSVSMVEIDRHGSTPVVMPVEIVNPRPLVTLPTQGTCSWDEAKELLRAFPDDIPAYIRLNVEIDDFLPAEAKAEAVQLTQGKQCRMCHINARRKSAARADAKTMTIEEFQAEPPMEIARRYAEDTGIVFDESLQEMFREVERLVEEDKRN